MEVRRIERRGRASRSTRDASDKENICPLEASVAAAEMMGGRRSPLPLGFPRSPLQDITHIIYPPNIWPEEDDSLSGQVQKKCKKENSAEVKALNVNVSGRGNWRSLKSCLHLKIEAEEHHAEETGSEQVNSGRILPIKRNALNDLPEGRFMGQGRLVAQANTIEHAEDDGVKDDLLLTSIVFRSRCEAGCMNQAFSVFRDGSAGFSSNAARDEKEAMCSNREQAVALSDSWLHTQHGVKDNAQHVCLEAEECIERGKAVNPSKLLHEADNEASGVRTVRQAHLLEPSENCEAGGAVDLLMNAKARYMHKSMVKEGDSKRQVEAVQMKERSTLSMLR
ncbi:hypothetical protein L7F22_057867 [Adiantum nelumboides]|nr:hypothetical protein [Adiantum nelumboides]